MHCPCRSSALRVSLFYRALAIACLQRKGVEVHFAYHSPCYSIPARPWAVEAKVLHQETVANVGEPREDVVWSPLYIDDFYSRSFSHIPLKYFTKILYSNRTWLSSLILQVPNR
jgi:hypothetical protein